MTASLGWEAAFWLEVDMRDVAHGMGTTTTAARMGDTVRRLALLVVELAREVDALTLGGAA